MKLNHHVFTSKFARRIFPLIFLCALIPVGGLAVIVYQHVSQQLDEQCQTLLKGLSGDSIHLGARILAVADVFDAMKSDRPCRDGMPLERVMRIIQQESGRQLDPVVVDALINTIYRKAPRAA